ncbi:UDP-N-acetylglucosamine 4,6-dehydratase [Labilithrix luteola]|uniref:UDP-N-acetylglucosamine 4,6-dehydratase n=1 Tax=Labilithrix luteola TaxID=1391654 RepID=A0A0K1Q5X7_9BACT|nr:UDP-N-acetylglucosamine 4,6-dehydratase [Labilithrix luteola]
MAEKVLPVARSVRCFDHGETELFFLHQRLAAKGNLAPQLGDIRDLDRLRMAMSGVDIVFHAAALKHVGLGEYNPFEVVQTNLHGVNNVIRAALDMDVARVIFTSSDKAVNPTNVMGASKMMGERLVVAANEIRGPRRTRFAAVRFGNVVGSRGSVVPIFASQLLRGEPLTLTDEQMTRYVMTIDEAAGLVLEAGARMLGGELFVTKMRALAVTDLASAMSEVLSRPPVDIVKMGLRPGEKLYEELLSAEEVPRTLDLERLLVVVPAEENSAASAELRKHYSEGARVTKEWNSSLDVRMTRAEIAAYLREHRILEKYLRPGGVIPDRDAMAE